MVSLTSKRMKMLRLRSSRRTRTRRSLERSEDFQSISLASSMPGRYERNPSNSRPLPLNFERYAEDMYSCVSPFLREASSFLMRGLRLS